MDNFDIMALYNGSIMSISILVFLLGIVAVKSARSTVARLSIVVFTTLVYVAIMLGPVQLLSYAKPLSMEWVNQSVPEAEVLHAEIREGDGIYLLLDWYGIPRYYKLVWNAELAQQLIEAMEQARQMAGNGNRAGARSPQQEQQSNEPVGEQSSLDAILGPIGEEEGSRSQEPLTEEQLQDGLGGQQGRGQQRQGQRSEMYNSGNGRVMMRFPFQDIEIEDHNLDPDPLEGRGPGASEFDTRTEAMFYPAPVPNNPSKQAN